MEAYIVGIEARLVQGKPLKHVVSVVRLEQDEARRVLERLPELSITLDKVTQKLEDEGVDKFNNPFDKLIAIWRKGQG